MKREYKVQSERYGRAHKFVSLTDGGNPYVFVPEQEWMPLYCTYGEGHTLLAVDTEGGPFMTAGWSNDEIVIERIVEEDGITKFYLKEKTEG